MIDVVFDVLFGFLVMEELDEMFILEEFSKVIDNFDCGKALGLDSILVEVLKYGKFFIF